MSIDKLIINNPYKEPTEHWHYVLGGRHERRQGRRPAGYSPHAAGDTLKELFWVNRIRSKVKNWRNVNYPGVTTTTKRLLTHWKDQDKRKERPFFFCQLEAIETLIWLTEVHPKEQEKIDIQGDGSDFVRWCCKMATGSGKTIVMAMIIAWQFLNKINSPGDERFSKQALIMTPGLTVKKRLQVLEPSHEDNYYEAFNIVPSYWREKLRKGKVVIHNWHALQWDTQEQLDKKPGFHVDKRKYMEISDAAYVRKLVKLRDKNIIVLNDEAHHAWRRPPKADDPQSNLKVDKDASTIWVGSLDRIHKQLGILQCFDLSATPFKSASGKFKEVVFTWIVSDFGLNDAIESGLVKTPLKANRDDSSRNEDYGSRLVSLYDKVKDSLKSKVPATHPLPGLLINAYEMLGIDWEKKRQKWQKEGQKVPPVMITVANHTGTSTRIHNAFLEKKLDIPGLCEPEHMLRIDSKALEKAEKGDKSEEHLRQQVNDIGKIGGTSEHISNVIAVQMLSEGWDAHTVTHIMGLRAFTSQLLCEQVIGRGLRRLSYEIGEEDGLFDAEYVNIFGVPFAYLPHEEQSGALRESKPKIKIEPLKERSEYAITWPNVQRIQREFTQNLTLDWTKVRPFELDPSDVINEVEMCQTIDGRPHIQAGTVTISGYETARATRLQTVIFKVALKLYRVGDWPDWRSGKGIFFAQLVSIVSHFIASGKITIRNMPYEACSTKWRAHFLRQVEAVVQHVYENIKIATTERLIPILDKENPINSTENVRPWHTAKPCEHVNKSHISHCVYDSRWEATEAYLLDTSPLVKSFVKNDHLGFGIFYRHNAALHTYRPDFIVHLANNKHLILEVKGQFREKDASKAAALKEWIEAVNNDGHFGTWCCDTSQSPTDLSNILETACA